MKVEVGVGESSGAFFIVLKAEFFVSDIFPEWETTNKSLSLDHLKHGCQYFDNIAAVHQFIGWNLESNAWTFTAALESQLMVG